MTDPVAMPLAPASTTRQNAERPRLNAKKETLDHFARNTSLEEFLGSAANCGGDKQAVAVLFQLLAKAAIHIADLAPPGHVAGSAQDWTDVENVENNLEGFNLAANEAFLNAIRRAPVAAVLAKEFPDAMFLDGNAPLAVAMDPLDGSLNIAANVPVGTTVAVFPTLPGASQPSEHFLRPGQDQIAAGLIIFGLQTCFVLTLGDGAYVFTLDRRANLFRLTIPLLTIPEDSTEYSVNASHYRHWDNSMRAYIDDCIKGADGPLRRDHTMRWTASSIADAYRILVRGGAFLDPGDRRHGHADSRLRLICEANPIAFLVEQAGGQATDTTKRILEIVPRDLQMRTSIVFGSSATVERIIRYHRDPHSSAERAPLFFQRGLIRR
ncbi:MAG: fructose-1,6-bisphosphatase [Acidobacteriota bacterium]|nr:fructose-1,6-bisphosphatase [Acidobacteriota bacterium]